MSGSSPILDSWSPPALGAIRPEQQLPVLTPDAWHPAIPHLDLWDMWQVADAEGRTLIREGREWWFFLAVPRQDDPEARHDLARIHLVSHGDGSWRDHGPAFPDGFTPGSREWSGSARLHADGTTLLMAFTAAGDRDGGPRFRQRLFECQGRLVIAGHEARCEGWSPPVETVAADGDWYARADQSAPVGGGIKGFRDPGLFRDPADGRDYLLFTGSAGQGSEAFDGVIGLARRDGGGWTLLPPLLSAIGTNSELERPHIVAQGGRLYLFWSTQGRRFAPGIAAPTGLYGMVADRLDGPWRPLNGSGLVAGNPPAAPYQAYCWWVTGDGQVLSFVDYAGKGDPHAASVAERRARFGGTPAPFFRLRFAGDRVTVA
jgi:levansucrase